MPDVCPDVQDLDGHSGSTLLTRKWSDHHYTSWPRLMQGSHVMGKSSMDTGEAADESPAIQEVYVESLSPRTFWLDYVSQRKPVLIEGHLQQKEWKASRKWTNDYLMRKAVCSLPVYCRHAALGAPCCG